MAWGTAWPTVLEQVFVQGSCRNRQVEQQHVQGMALELALHGGHAGATIGLNSIRAQGATQATALEQRFVQDILCKAGLEQQRVQGIACRAGVMNCSPLPHATSPLP